jgi:hypothetical protein
VAILKDRAKDGPIKWPAMNLTLISGTTISVGLVLTAWQGIFDEFFGFKPADQPGAAAAIFAALVAAIALIFAADLIARGIASSKASRATTMPSGWTATLILDGSDEEGYAVAAVRATNAGPEFFVVKDGKPASWRTLGTGSGNVKLKPPL